MMHPDISRIVGYCGACMTVSDKASTDPFPAYVIFLERIEHKIPVFDRFADAENFLLTRIIYFENHVGMIEGHAEGYATLFHELAHWSEIRLGWNGSCGMGELIAEMTACYLSSELQLPQSEDQGYHESYIQSWLQAMENDSKWIFQAAKQADKATDFLLSFSRKPNALSPDSDAA